MQGIEFLHDKLLGNLCLILCLVESSGDSHGLRPFTEQHVLIF